MPFIDETLYDPARIIIDRDLRQRRELEIDPAFEASIIRNGVIEPIIVHRDSWKLVAGERRTVTALKHNIKVPIRFYDTLDLKELKRIELEENVKRQDLPWRDMIRAYAELHKIYTDEHTAAGEEWSVGKSAEELGLHAVSLYDYLRVFANLNSPRLADATSYRQAQGILQRFAERKASAIVAEITAAGTRIFADITPPQAQEISSGISTPSINTVATNLAINGREPTASSYTPPPSSLNGSSGSTNNSQTTTIPQEQNTTQTQAAIATPPPIAVGNFLEWAPQYTGEPFTFIHCDFPYGVNTADSLTESYENNAKIYWELLDCLCSNASRMFSYSSHLMFWLSMRDDFFQPTKQKLRAVGFHVIDRPLIWLKSDSRGAAPGVRGTQPRHIYEAALLCSRGQRPLVKQGGDGYAAPSVTNPIHPTQKPESMLHFFFSMLVDETTTFFDPTAGSGASIRAAEFCGARSACGLELDEGYAAAANAATIRARNARLMSSKV